MAKPWFDPQTGMLLIDHYVTETESYHKIMADGQVTAEEIAEHAQRVVGLMRGLEERLPAELHERTTEMLVELAVLFAIDRKHDLDYAGFPR